MDRTGSLDRRGPRRVVVVYSREHAIRPTRRHTSGPGGRVFGSSPGRPWGTRGDIVTVGGGGGRVSSKRVLRTESGRSVRSPLPPLGRDTDRVGRGFCETTPYNVIWPPATPPWSGAVTIRYTREKRFRAEIY